MTSSSTSSKSSSARSSTFVLVLSSSTRGLENLEDPLRELEAALSLEDFLEAPWSLEDCSLLEEDLDALEVISLDGPLEDGALVGVAA